MLSLSKYERARKGFSNIFLVNDLNSCSLSVNPAFPILTLRQASFARLRTGRANGKKQNAREKNLFAPC
ncbi:MAG: hypothetical protein LBD67_06620 [Candidatus Accumulibacter sp.]|nr:hypothetical protein [Accumulibacter sp.]